MNKINEELNNFFRWRLNELLKAIIGCFIFAFAINIFIVPNSLYNGGILGISQLIRSGIEKNFNINLGFDIAGIINLTINIPLFIMAYKMISKTFFRRTVICVAVQTLFLTIIPTPEKALINDILTCVLIGGIMAGYGSGMILSASGSGGGTDIIGLAISMRKKNASVGKIGRTINLFIYTICGVIYGIQTMIYSILYTVFASLIIDQTHDQNIISSVMIFTKENPEKIADFTKKELKRDITFWEGYGGFDNTKTYISYCALSKYEMQRLERHLHELSSQAFMIKSDGIGIEGNFKKNLTNQ